MPVQDPSPVNNPIGRASAEDGRVSVDFGGGGVGAVAPPSPPGAEESMALSKPSDASSRTSYDFSTGEMVAVEPPPPPPPPDVEVGGGDAAWPPPPPPKAQL